MYDFWNFQKGGNSLGHQAGRYTDYEEKSPLRCKRNAGNKGRNGLPSEMCKVFPRIHGAEEQDRKEHPERKASGGGLADCNCSDITFYYQVEYNV